MKLTRIPHMDGDLGVDQTIRQMRRLIQQGKQDPQIHELAARILRAARIPSFDGSYSVGVSEARAIFNWPHKNIRFTRDIHGNETLHAAPDILRLGIADCDDFTILMCSLLMTIGAECRIITIATDPDGEFCHVYPEVEISGRWIPMDAARKHAAFGKGPAHFTRKWAWPVDAEGHTEMRGLGDGRQSIAPGQGPQGAWRASVYPPFRLAARRMTGTYLAAFPVAPPHQQFKRPPVGFGNYGPAAARRALSDYSRGDMRRTLGDSAYGQCAPGDTACEIATIIGASTQGTANVIAAERASPYNLAPTTAPGSVSSSRVTYPSPASEVLPFGIDPTTLLLIGGLAIAAISIGGGGRR